MLYVRILQMEYDLLKQSRDCYDDLSTMPPAADYEVAGNHVSAHENVEVENSRDVEMLAEAKLLRQHKGRLESRMHMLEEHNQQLEWQLSRLRQLLDQVSAAFFADFTQSSICWFLVNTRLCSLMRGCELVEDTSN